MTQIPRLRTTTFGRETELEQLVALIRRGDPLITLTGLGGVGKTRLALAAAERMSESLAVAFCNTAQLCTMRELTVVLEQTLGLTVSPSVMLGDGLDAIGHALSRLAPGKGLLLVLDDFEALATVAAAPISRLVAVTRDLQVLVTSRVALRSKDETVLQVAPLPMSAAVELLTARSQAREGSPWRTDYDGLLALARQLDGIPLALELAAARADLVTPRELRALLDEGARLALPGNDPRHASRDAAVSWTWERLSTSTRRALEQLVWLDGGFDLELMAIALGTTGVEAMTALEELVHSGLVASDGTRHRLLETVRDFVRARAEPRDDADIGPVDRVLSYVKSREIGALRALPPNAAEFVLRASEVYLGVLRRASHAQSRHLLRSGLIALGHLMYAFRRSVVGGEILLDALGLLEHPLIETLPLDERIDAGAIAITIAVCGERADIAIRLEAKVNGWLNLGEEAEARDPRLMAVAKLARSFALFHSHRHREALALADEVLALPTTSNALDLRAYAVACRVTSKRALGLSDWDTDSAALATVRVVHTPIAVFLRFQLAMLALQTGRLELALEHVSFGARVASEPHSMIHILCLRVSARVHAERGEFGVALRHFDDLVARQSGTLMARDRNETLLDRVATAIEAGRYGEARAGLERMRGALGSAFEEGYHSALSGVVDLLTGASPKSATRTPRTGSVEDAALDLLTALAARADTTGALHVAHAVKGHSYRVRQALRLAEVFDGLPAAEHRVDVLAFALDGDAFRLGTHWVEFGEKHLLRALLGALVDRALDCVGGGLSVHHLVQRLWPHERIALEVLERRLQVAISALRKLGVGTALVFEGDAYRFADHVRVVRVARSASGGAASAQLPPRRGRPRAARRHISKAKGM